MTCVTVFLQPGDEEYNMVRKTRIEQNKETYRNIYCVQSKGQFCVVIFSTDGYLFVSIYVIQCIYTLISNIYFGMPTLEYIRMYTETKFI